MNYNLWNFYKNIFIGFAIVLIFSFQIVFAQNQDIDESQDISDLQTELDDVVNEPNNEYEQDLWENQYLAEGEEDNKGKIFQQDLPEFSEEAIGRKEEKERKREEKIQANLERKEKRSTEKESERQERARLRAEKRKRREDIIQAYLDKKNQEAQKVKDGKELKRQMKIKKEEYEEYKYTLGKDDVIDINVRRHPEFSGRFPVGPNGKIQYPFVGDIELAGLTKTETTEMITELLSEFITVPEVDLTIVAYNSKIVYVLGMVGRPGKYSMRSEFMPVRDAVMAAGLPRENITALRRAVIIRPLEDGQVLVKNVNLLRLLYNGKLELNYDLRSEDIVYLPSTALYKVSTVLGQVVSPFFKSSAAYGVWEEDVLYRDEPKR